MADPIAIQPYVLPPEAWLANPEPAVTDDAGGVGENSGFYAVPSGTKKPALAVTTPEPSSKKPQSLPVTFGTGRPGAMAGTIATQGLDTAQLGLNLAVNIQGGYSVGIPILQFQGGDSDSIAYEGKAPSQKAWDDYWRLFNGFFGGISSYVPVNRSLQADTNGDLSPKILGIVDLSEAFNTPFHPDLGAALLSSENSWMIGIGANGRILGLSGKYLGSDNTWADKVLLGSLFTMTNGQSADAGTDANYSAHHPDGDFVQSYRYGVVDEFYDEELTTEEADALLEALGNDDPTVLAGSVEAWEAANNKEIDADTVAAIIAALDDEQIHLSVFPTLFMLGKLREASSQFMATANSGLAAQAVARLDGKFNLPLSLSMAVGSMVMSQTPNLIDAAVAGDPFELNPTALAVSGASQVLGAVEAELASGDRHLSIALGRANNLAVRAYYDPKYYAYSGQFIFTGDENELMTLMYLAPLIGDGLSNLSTGALIGDHLQQAVEDKDWREAVPFALATSVVIAYDVHSLILSQPKQSAVDAVKDNDLDIEIHGNENLWIPATVMSLTYGGGVVLGYFGVNDWFNEGLSKTLFGVKKTDPVTGAYLPGQKGITDFSFSPTGPQGSNGPTIGATVGFKF